MYHKLNDETIFDFWVNWIDVCVQFVSMYVTIMCIILFYCTIIVRWLHTSYCAVGTHFFTVPYCNVLCRTSLSLMNHQREQNFIFLLLSDQTCSLFYCILLHCKYYSVRYSIILYITVFMFFFALFLYSFLSYQISIKTEK